MIKQLKTRFAPTPSGYLHAGNGISFIITWALARAFEGSILLRIDDLDAARCRPEYLEDIFKTLDWLGLDYDEGASGVADFLQNYSQHTRLDLYAQALEKLQNLNTDDDPNRLYACRCSRRDIQETAQNGIYPNTCRSAQINLSAPDVAWRLKLPDDAKATFSEWQKDSQTIDLEQVAGDFIVRQKNGLPSYQLASVVDDDLFGINFVVRGADLLPSTAAQIFISTHLEGSFFAQNTLFHHKLLENTEGGKLSKSAGAASLKSLREASKNKDFLFQEAANWLGFDTPSVSNKEILLDLCRNRFLGELLPLFALLY